jgi:hypothetical protein
VKVLHVEVILQVLVMEEVEVSEGVDQAVPEVAEEDKIMIS